MPDCPFCEMAARRPLPHAVYEDASFMVIPDRQSLGPGHCMIIPRRHVTKVYELGKSRYTALFRLAQELAPCLERATGAKAVSYTVFSSGLPHADLHLVPHDDIRVLLRPLEYVRELSESELEANAAHLRAFVPTRLLSSGR
ncbi:MAG: HIT domain-containing protein [Chloroflexi bacterium]|nr:HIT domain-containing protein [Chloroflexota bacterium]